MAEKHADDQEFAFEESLKTPPIDLLCYHEDLAGRLVIDPGCVPVDDMWHLFD
jgi:hypothetical protein